MEYSFFIDTSGFYSLLVNSDPHHHKAESFLQKVAKNRLIGLTTDYIVLETSTLLKARGKPKLARFFFSILDSTNAVTLINIDHATFRKTKDFFLKYEDHGYSFADCSSFVLMKEHHIMDALTHDHHFSEAGFVSVLS